MPADTHFQTYHATTTPAQGANHVAALRAQLRSTGLDGFIIPHEDEHQNEYLPDANERLAWVSGFTGSAGAALILMDQAILFADGRYTLQSRIQTDPALFTVADYSATAVADTLAALPSGLVIGYDARLHSPRALFDFQAAAHMSGITLKAVTPNPLDMAWGEARPTQPAAPVVPYPLEYAGAASADKRAELAADLTRQGVVAALITAPSSIAWLFNIRGGDVIRSPLPLAQGLLYADGRADLFLEPSKVTDGLEIWLGNQVRLLNPDQMTEAFAALSGQSVLIDAHLSAASWFDALGQAGANVISGEDPCTLPRACKNATEIKNTTAAHIRDGAVMAEFLFWLSTEATATLPTEIEVAQKLESLRLATGKLKDLSFDTISGFGPNGAVVHYRVTDDTNLRLSHGNLMLVDSGAQYLDGTTDITRTVAIGTPATEQKHMFTLVLKGHIALATARFPQGTTGTHLDALARQYLWAEGYDYDHGTGHGVGVYLGVHEGPQRISKALNAYALKPGMIVSNEPGYYRENAFGIRIENLQYVTEPDTGGERPMLGFKNLTWAPIDRNLIDVTLLSPAERAYMDAYHAEVLRLTGPLVRPEVRDWLAVVCQPL
ncbi:aminopeptidase P family protein [Asticcacaulis tiandongensis]|uniref:aminopeptidase P family protein n=1 Tax=Asticcacaulis tiandongensis TaxID=2565365 RepID=UPI001126C971|nr:aminopeptidase P family protein [Asticcacaulis tiandongensis]